jgi:hypothetical protein
MRPSACQQHQRRPAADRIANSGVTGTSTSVWHRQAGRTALHAAGSGSGSGGGGGGAQHEQQHADAAPPSSSRDRNRAAEAPPPSPAAAPAALHRRGALSLLCAAATPLPSAVAAAAAAASSDPPAPSDLGEVGGTLNDCQLARVSCASSMSDDERYFYAPWEFDGKRTAAVDRLVEVGIRI